MEEVKQDDAFVRVLLERVLHLLYITLQERASAMPTLHHDLGLPATHKVPVSAPSASNIPKLFICMSLRTASIILDLL